MPNLLEVVKRAAVEAVNAEDPTDIIFGTVTSVSPLSIMVDQKQALTKEFLILTNNVKDHSVVITCEGVKKTYTVHNALKKGDIVLLIKKHGGQEYIILDKGVSA